MSLLRILETIKQKKFLLNSFVYQGLKIYQKKKKLYISIFLLVLKQTITILYFVYFTKNYLNFFQIRYLDSLQNLIFVNLILVNKYYIMHIVRMHFFILFNKRTVLLPLTIEYIIRNLAKSFNSCIIVYLSYLLLFYNSVETFFISLFFVPFNFLVLVSDILFFAILYNFNFNSNKNLITLYLLFEILIFLSVLKGLNYYFYFLTSVIIHIYFLYSIFYYLSFKNLFLTIQKIFCIILIFNIDTLFFPEMVKESFYFSYKIIINNYLLIRKLLYNIIYFLATEKKLETYQKYILFLLSGMIIFYLFHNVYNFDLLNSFKKLLNFQTNKINNVLFLLYIHLDILLYGISKITLLSLRKNLFYKNYFFTFINVLVYSLCSLLLKFLIYTGLWPHFSLFFNVATIWHITYIISFIILLKF